jgi:integrase
MAATPDQVPLCYRVLYGFLAREGMRTSEAAGLRWADITWTDDGAAAVTLDENKTDDRRAWTLSDGVARALEAWRKLTNAPEGEDHIFRDDFGRAVDPERLAEKFRQHLMAAGVARKQLYETTASRRRIRAHDLRATFITVALANDRSEAWVTDRTGHESSVMLAKYKRAARTVAELGAGDMLPLDQAVPELANPGNGTGNGTKKQSTSGGMADAPDLGSGGATRGGSSPSSCTNS